MYILMFILCWWHGWGPWWVCCCLQVCGIAAAVKVSWAFVLRFCAGFCLLAQGLYLTAGSFQRIGDCDVLLNHGAPMWQLWLFGILTVPLGLFLWHGQGAHFGLGKNAHPVRPAIACTCLAACMLMVILGLTITKLGEA